MAEGPRRFREPASVSGVLGLQLRYRTEERFTRLRSTERILDLYAKGIVPQDRMAIEAALANYQSGRVPFVAVLESLQTLYADRAGPSRGSRPTTRASLRVSRKRAGSQCGHGPRQEMLCGDSAPALRAMSGGMSGR